MRDRIPLDTADIPYRAHIALGQNVFTLEVHYNSAMDAYIVHLYKREQLVCAGELLVYGRQMWADMYEPGEYPALRIVPLDESGTAERVTKETFGKLVFLTIDDDSLVVSEADG